MRWRRSPALALLSLLLGLSLTECSPLIGLDEDYYVAGRGGGSGQGGTTPSAGSTGVSGGGSAGLASGGAGEGGGATDVGGAGGEAAAAGVAGAGGEMSSLPAIPAGKLVYHRYTDYYAGDSEMFIVTFPERTVSANLATSYALCNPVNGTFSPDGNTLAVTAEPLAEPCPPTNALQQDVYLLDLLNPPQMQKVTGNTVPDEDPQYSPDGSFILFKHNLRLAKWQVGSGPFTDCTTLPAGAACFASSTPEQSKPVMHPDGVRVFYHESWGPMADIYSFDLTAGETAADINTIRTPIVQHDDLSDARPTFSATHLYYVRWNAQDTPDTTPLDQIMRRPLSDLLGVEEPPEFAVDEGSDYSDPFSIDGDLVIFASDITGYGLHDLFIGDWLSADEVHSLNEWIPGINTAKDELGGVFWRAEQP